MRAAILLLISASMLPAQGLPQSKPITGLNIDSSKLILTMPLVHIHPIMHGSCTGQPDHVYADDKGGVYYACISGKDICTDAKAHRGSGIPRALITQFQQVKKIQEAERVKHQQEQKERQEERVRLGLSTGDPAQDAALTRQRLAAISRAQGRSTAATAGTVAPVTAKRASAAPIADEKLNTIGTGTPIADVINELGNPYTRIAGESERLTYRLESGRTARLEFERGVLAHLEIQPAR